MRSVVMRERLQTVLPRVNGIAADRIRARTHREEMRPRQHSVWTPDKTVCNVRPVKRVECPPHPLPHTPSQDCGKRELEGLKVGEAGQERRDVEMDADKLQRILALHGEFLRGAEGGVRADLTRANLTDANLRRANLTRANLSGADLFSADLTRANLTDANLTRANLSDANLTRAKLTDANLSGANLAGADLSGANLTDADLSGADLTRAKLTGADLTHANLSGANLTGAKLTDANLSGADLFSADLTRANLSDAKLTRANLTGANLADAAGNKCQVKSFQIEKYSVTYTASVLQIGCENYEIDDWWGFDDIVISKMDRGALDWWKRWKPVLRQIIEMSPATPTGHEARATA